MSVYYHEENECARFLYRRDDLDEDEYRIVLLQVLPKPGFWIYEIKANYDKTKASISYPVLAKSKRDAKRRFSAIVPWLTVRGCRLIPPGKETDRLLYDPEQLIFW